MSAATVNKDLRHLKAALRRAHEWKMIAELPKVRMLKEKKRLPTFIPPEHFDLIYRAADAAELPKGPTYGPGEWWRAFITLAYTTGWRLGELLRLKWSDVYLDRGEVVTRDNKASREEATPLHPVAADHLRAVFDPEDRKGRVFPWDHDPRRLYNEFWRIQRAAGVEMGCSESHKHTLGCRFYSFHDLRRGFASLNALNMPADALQRLMRHKDYTTTQRYVNIARNMRDIAGRLVVPESARTGGMRETMGESRNGENCEDASY